MVELVHAPVAQWIRASVFGTEGRRFESYPVYHVKIAAHQNYMLFIGTTFAQWHLCGKLNIPDQGTIQKISILKVEIFGWFPL